MTKKPSDTSVLFLQSQNKCKECRCFQMKCKYLLPTNCSHRSPVIVSAELCPTSTLVSIAAVSPGWYCHIGPVVSVWWCVVMVVSVVCGGGSRPLTPGCSGSSSSPAQQQCAVYSSTAQHAAPSARGGYIPLQHCTDTRPTPRATRGLIKQRGNIHRYTRYTHIGGRTRATFWYYRKRQTVKNMFSFGVR